ncbi:hypothetical protein L3Q82_003411 [Scortum barcoo]|uniref:Uncharacterized protein n=1 Tax=Scortum barcoo TaxID=214431 RepID=A0ACB8VMB0_9TELE|nr:hypothetical protein L3Q82_003411 [Scortum barcoo]
MESGGGTEVSDSEKTGHAVSEQQRKPRPETADRTELSAMPSAQHSGEKKINRAPSPARPKDVPGWPPTKIRGGIETPTLNVKPVAMYFGSHISRRSPVGSLARKDAKAKASGGGKLAGHSSSFAASLSKTPAAKNTGGRRKVSDANVGSEDLSKDSGCATGKFSPTDSSSELSDCTSDDNKLYTEAVCIHAGSNSGRGGRTVGDKRTRNGALADLASQKATKKTTLFSAERDYKDQLLLGVDTVEESISSCEERPVSFFGSGVPVSTSLSFSDFTEEFFNGMHEELVREIEELRSENDYLKDEMEELRSEMLEMRDMYMEEHVYQLQEQRQQLEQANKTCQILQYRLRKAERRSLRVAQTGQVDGELIRTMEQDVKVAKDVSIRLHNQLDSIEKKRSRLEEENEELRIRLQDLEVAKQVLQQEIDKIARASPMHSPLQITPQMLFDQIQDLDSGWAIPKPQSYSGEAIL